MKHGIQTFFDEAGDAACYALDIIQIASEFTGKNLDPVASLELGIAKRFIKYSYSDKSAPDNFYVSEPSLFLAALTGRTWWVRKERFDYESEDGDYVVERWEYSPTGSVIGHFRLPHWDSLVDSKTVRYGKIVSKRVFRLEGK